MVLPKVIIRLEDGILFDFHSLERVVTHKEVVRKQAHHAIRTGYLTLILQSKGLNTLPSNKGTFLKRQDVLVIGSGSFREDRKWRKTTLFRNNLTFSYLIQCLLSLLRIPASSQKE